MKLKVKAALEMLEAITQLDGYHNGSDKLSLYKYGGDIRLKIAIARRKLRVVQEDYMDSRNRLIRDISGAEALQTTAHSLEFMDRHKEMLATEIEVDIQPLSIEAFKLDENPIPPSVLDMLGDFIEVRP